MAAVKFCPTCKREFAEDADLCPEDGSRLVFEPADPLVGTTFGGRYKVLSRIGQGGMCTVYKARHMFMDRAVAVKLLRSRFREDELVGKRFQQEAKAASRLNHPNIVAVYDFGIAEEGRAFLVMDFVDGQTLAQILDRDGHVPVERATRLFSQICDGLAHAHENGILHRDLKPANILVTTRPSGDDLAKISDFGLAKLLSQGEGDQQKLTQTGEVFGTSLYMSPEQGAGKQPDARSDIYALGCLMYETLVGLPPFVGTNILDTIQKHITEAPPAFQEIRTDITVPAALESIVMKCLSKSPDDRFQSAAELRSKIEHAAGPTRLLTEMSEAKMKALDGSGRRSALGIKLAAGLAVVLAVGALLLLSFRPFSGPSGSASVKSRPVNLWKHSDEQGQAAYEQGRYPDALRHFLRAVKAAEAFGPSDPRLLLSLGKLSDVYYIVGDYAEADKTDARIKAVKQELAQAEAAAGKMESAAEDTAGAQSGKVERLASLAEACHAKGQCNTAERLLKRSLEMAESMFGPSSPQVEARVNDLAAFYLAMGQDDKAEPYMKRLNSAPRSSRFSRRPPVVK